MLVTSTGLKADQPRLIATIPYSSFTASTTLNYKIDSSLNRNARHRTFTIVNQTNQPFSASQPGIFMYDSTVVSPSSIPIGVNSQTFGNNSMSAGGWAIGTSEQYGYLGAHADSLFASIPMGATVPTSGNVLVYVTELF